MDLYLKNADIEEVKKDFQAVKFHALQYLLGRKYLLAVACYQWVRHLEHTKGMTINLWGEDAKDT